MTPSPSRSQTGPSFEALQRFTVEFSYPVHFTRGAFANDNRLLADTVDRLGEGRRHRVLAVLDEGLVRAQPDLPGRIAGYFQAHHGRLELAAPPAVVPGGEEAKNGWTRVQALMRTMGDLHLCRQSFVLAVGGGALLDMAGFAASIVHRGLRLVRMPTTTLSQNDGGVGVKNGMDEHGQKNFVGTFAPPFAVINDLDMLRTLDQTDWIAGVAEAFKVAIIKDADFFGFLCSHAAALAGRDEAAMEQTVRRCAAIHLEHIRTGGDPFEFGSARPLDFGHWSAHWLETRSGYALGHGQAVAVGIALDSCYAARQGLISVEERDRILAGLKATGLPVWHSLLAETGSDGRLAVLEGLDRFREHLGGKLTVTLPRGLGSRCEVHNLDDAAVAESIRRLASGLAL